MLQFRVIAPKRSFNGIAKTEYQVYCMMKQHSGKVHLVLSTDNPIELANFLCDMQTDNLLVPY